MAWPNSILTYPFSGILSGYVIHPYHISRLYDELSGIEQDIGFLPKNGFSSITARITGIESGYFNLTTSLVRAPLVLVNNGLTSILSGKFASSTESGFLSLADWTTFNSKQSTITANAPLVLSSNVLSGKYASATESGLLSNSDWSTFNNKQNTLTFNAPLVLNGAVVSGKFSSATESGFLSSADWNTFNNKQAALSYTAVDSGFNLIPTNGLYAQKNGSILEFKSLVAGTNITLTPNTTGIVIDATGGGATQSGSTFTSPATSIESGLTSWSGVLGQGFRSPNLFLLGDDYLRIPGRLSIGYGAEVVGQNSVVIGSGVASGLYSLLVGQNNSSKFDNSFVFGSGNRANTTAGPSFIFGQNSVTSGNWSFVFGVGARVNASGAAQFADSRQNFTDTNNTIDSFEFRYQSGVVLTTGTNLYPKISGFNSVGITDKRFDNVYSNKLNNNTIVTFKGNEVPAGTINGSNKVFTWTATPIVNTLMLFQNGLYLAPSGIGAATFDYVLSGSTTTMISAPASGTTLIGCYTYVA